MSQQNYHIFSSGELKRENDTLAFRADDQDAPQFIPINSVEILVFHNQVRINTQLLQVLDENNIAAFFFSWSGKFVGSFLPTQSPVSGELLVKQVESTTHPERRRQISQSILKASIYNMRQTASYYKKSEKSVTEICRKLSQLEDEIEDMNTREELMGKEAEARKEYYKLFDIVTPEDFSFTRRTYNPPENRFNALISFGNMILYSNIEAAICSTGLNPTISYVHTPSNRRQSLALDLADIFKPIIIDRTILRLINRKQITHSDFNTEVENIVLTEGGRKKFLKAYENTLEETIEHPTLKRKVSHQTLLRLEAQKLKKHILTNEGYTAFKRWW